VGFDSTNAPPVRHDPVLASANCFRTVGCGAHSRREQYRQAQPRDLPIAQWQHSTTLNRSEATIKVRVLHILQKLNAADRTEAMTLGLQRGIIHLP
jgi:DNA-binding CsgD family transcriptional regulator